MPIFNKFYLLIFALVLGACKEEYVVYEIDDTTILPINSEKNKAKSSAQYISILYTNLFQSPIGPNNLVEAQAAVASIGDKQVAYDMLVSKYMRTGNIILPSKDDMRLNTEEFIRATYKRFLVRQPTESELQWMLSYIENRPQLTPEMVYFAFATSNEHFHY